MKSKLSIFFAILFWGIIWGIIEATIGWALHATQLHHGTSNILFAFGIFCMLSAAGRSGKGSMAVMLTAVVAAVIKLADFLLPGVEGGVLHPAMYILLEGAMIAIICQVFSFRPRFKSNPTVALWESRLAVPAFAVAVALTLIVG